MLPIILLTAVLTVLADDVELKELDLRLDKNIAGLRFDGRRDYKLDGAGYSLTYANKMCKVDLYVYDAKQHDIPDGNSSKQVDQERSNATSELPNLERKGLIKNLHGMEGELPFSKDLQEKFTVDGFTFEIPGGPCKSYLLITGFKKHFIKIRATQYVVDGESNDTELLNFIAEISRNVDIAQKK